MLAVIQPIAQRSLGGKFEGLRCEIDVPLTSPVPSQAALAEDDAVIVAG